MLTIYTLPCPLCGKASSIEVEEEAFRNWNQRGMHIQNAFPKWSDDERELLITGTHPNCWDILFPDEEDIK